MTKAAEMAKTTTKSSFHLLWGLVASTIISAIGTIYIANLLTPNEYGLYTLAIAAATLVGVFRDWGINAALIKYTAQCAAEDLPAKTKKVISAGLIFEVASGIILTIVGFLLSTLFASIYQIAEIAPLIQIASFTILINAFLVVAGASFTGLFRMELNSITLIIQSITKVLLIPALVIIGLGVFGAIVGYTIAFLISGITGILLLWLLYKNLPHSNTVQTNPQETPQSETKNIIKMLLKYGLPLSIAAIIGAFQGQFYTILMGVYVSTEAVGNYSLANTFVVLITFFATPITTMLFPAFSTLDPQKDKQALQSVYQFSVKYATLLVVPVAAIVMALAQPGISTLFGNKYADAPLFLTLLALNYTYTAFGTLSTGNLINGQGKTGFMLKLSLITAAIGVPLSVILTQQLGVTGIIITVLTAGLPSQAISLVWIKKHYDLTIDWGASAKIVFSSGLAGVLTFFLQSTLALASWITLVIGAATFTLLFLPAILLTGAINKADIENLRQMTTSLGPVNRLLSPILTFIEKLLSKIKPSAEPTYSMPIKETPP